MRRRWPSASTTGGRARNGAVTSIGPGARDTHGTNHPGVFGRAGDVGGHPVAGRDLRRRGHRGDAGPRPGPRAGRRARAGDRARRGPGARHRRARGAGARLHPADAAGRGALRRALPAGGRARAPLDRPPPGRDGEDGRGHGDRPRLYRDQGTTRCASSCRSACSTPRSAIIAAARTWGMSRAEAVDYARARRLPLLGHRRTRTAPTPISGGARSPGVCSTTRGSSPPTTSTG